MLISKSSNGLSLLEVLVVLAIIGLVAAISVPNISSWTSSRIINEDLGQIKKLIDYAKVNSVKERKMFLLVNNESTKSIQLFETKNTNNSTSCASYNSSTYENASGYPEPQTITSSLLAQRGSSNGFSESSSELCFYSDGTISTNTTGYELRHKDDAYRILFWLTGFYETHRSTEGICPDNKKAYDINTNVIQNWCETS